MAGAQQAKGEQLQSVAVAVCSCLPAVMTACCMMSYLGLATYFCLVLTDKSGVSLLLPVFPPSLLMVEVLAGQVVQAVVAQHVVHLPAYGCPARALTFG
jgi:hypothetical protein